MRLPRDIGDDPVLHSVLLAYSSDYPPLDIALRGHPEPVTIESSTAFSLDHSMWLHRPVRFDRWHSHTAELVAGRGTAVWYAARSTTSTATWLPTPPRRC